MPVRATKRGAERTPLSGSYDVVDLRRVVRRARRRARARGQPARACWCSTATRSASARPRPARRRRDWLEALGLERSIRQTFDELVIHTPLRSLRWALPWTLLDVRLPRSCARCCGTQCGDARFETAKVSGRSARRTRRTSCTPTAATCAPLVVDALGWRRVLSNAPARSSRRTRGCRAGSRCTPAAASPDLELWLDPRYVRAGLLLELPGRRRGARRRRLVRPARARQGADRAARRRPRRFRPTASRATGSRTSCAPRSRTASSSPATAPATACPRPPRASAPRCLLRRACGRELRAVLDGRAGARAGARALRRRARGPALRLALAAARRSA